jgi:transposase-like protein
MFVQSKHREREAARERRKQGWSLAAIAAALGVAKSSVSVWVRDITPPAPPRPERRAGRPSGPPCVPAAAQAGATAKWCPR